jgi:hypothetical protein
MNIFLAFLSACLGHLKTVGCKNSLCDLMEYQMEDDEDNTESSVPSIASSGFCQQLVLVLQVEGQ